MTAAGNFDGLREELPCLSPFSSAEGLLAFLQKRDETATGRKNEILHALVLGAKRTDDLGERAKTLLLAAMWPGLDHSCLRLSSFLKSSEDPFSEVYWAFLEEVREWNPEKRDFVALNLQRNTERRVRGAVRREQLYQEASGRLREAGRLLGTHRLWAATGDDPKARLDDSTRAGAEALLHELVGRNVISLEESLLIVGHALYGRQLAELAFESGVRYRTLSKRYQRAADKVRRAILLSEDSSKISMSPEDESCPFSLWDDDGPEHKGVGG